MNIYLTTKKLSATSECACACMSQNVHMRPISPSRDWSWKDEILIEHISNHKEYFSHVGVSMCAQEPKICVYEAKEIGLKISTSF